MTSRLTADARDRLLRGEWAPTEPQPYDIRIQATKSANGVQLHAVLHAADGTPLIDFGEAAISDGASLTVCGLKMTLEEGTFTAPPALHEAARMALDALDDALWYVDGGSGGPAPAIASKARKARDALRAAIGEGE